MKSTHTFTPILTPNPSYVKKQIYFAGVPVGPKNIKTNLNDIQKLFQEGFVIRLI